MHKQDLLHRVCFQPPESSWWHRALCSQESPGDTDGTAVAAGRGAKHMDLLLDAARTAHEWDTAGLALKQPGVPVPARGAGTKRSARD